MALAGVCNRLFSQGHGVSRKPAGGRDLVRWKLTAQLLESIFTVWGREGNMSVAGSFGWKSEEAQDSAVYLARIYGMVRELTWQRHLRDSVCGFLDI